MLGRGIVINLLGLFGVMGMVGVGRAGFHDPFQATVAVPVIWGTVTLASGGR